MVVTIEILKKTKSAYTYEDGERIYRILSKEFNAGNSVEISFYGIDSIPSSFANGCFVKLLENFGMDRIRKDLSITNSTKQINQMIRSRLSFESDRLPKN